MLNNFDGQKIHLDHDLCVAVGGRRVCYQHPQRDDLCIKVLKTGLTKDNQLEREIKYHTFYKREGIGNKHIAGLHGVINTSLGKGVIFDLVRDANNEVSKTLEYYINNGMQLEQIKPLLLELKNFLLENKLHLSDLAADNVVIRISGACSELVIIDGAVNSDFIKICDYSEFFRKIKVERKWRRFLLSLQHLEFTSR